MQTKAVLTVLGKDRSGVVATISGTLFAMDANIDDISQTILSGMFAMTMMVSLNEATHPFEEVQEALAADSEKLGMQVQLQREDVFNFMHAV
ncbi:MAG: ACT domain-containing protein [Coriobacteriales bacterium]|jgi:ACT domain-containing protein|nr:ACT domain-containing protein [Coriobacteriales bacterium]